MLEATKLAVAVKNIEMPDERHAFEHASLKHSQPARRHDRPHGVSARLEVVDRCWGPVLSTGRLKG